ncbi:hypothetical protein M7I_6719 [Glarea lozoyensis 74030]|uniref:Uncharacterized protein n=1 Tax=Glarea lozoyensis (strain ATCC 74030 / MF5533) TaxID=1104152 RepID=H0EVC2_GLAL7|nr:hypothetical protein M7I_6719 [Glarea lozoyensis 74030]
MSSIATTRSAIVIGVVCPIIGGILVTARFWVRWRRKIKWSIDDWLCLAAWVCTTGCCASLLTGVYINAFTNEPDGVTKWVMEKENILARVCILEIPRYTLETFFKY